MERFHTLPHATYSICIHVHMHVYVHVCRIEMYRTVDCVRKISVYRCRSKIVYRDFTRCK